RLHAAQTPSAAQPQSEQNRPEPSGMLLTEQFASVSYTLLAFGAPPQLPHAFICITGRRRAGIEDSLQDFRAHLRGIATSGRSSEVEQPVCFAARGQQAALQ